GPWWAISAFLTAAVSRSCTRHTAIPARPASTSCSPAATPGRWCAAWPTGPGRSGFLVFPELVPHDAADLADRGVVLERGADRLEQVAAAACHFAQLLEPPLHGLLVAVVLELPQPVDLIALRLRIDPEDLNVVDRVGHVLVHADHDVLLDPVALLV